ncbi:ABC transporter permease [Mycoplasmopsis iners]|uniref:ABC transporter permease n=1 Tax=Mycoplasmopsis iners TaxID=76630 RepID=UPI000495DE1C|nr:ABC transporter permease [Mycoplasmopsis iners]
MVAFANSYNWILLFFCILSIAAISGMFTERAGIVNIAVNGMMIFGALGYLMFSHHFLGETNPWLVIPATLAGVLFGAVASLIFGFAVIKLKSSQTISGFAFNLLAVGIALIFLTIFGDAKKLQNTFHNLEFAIAEKNQIWSVPIISFPLVCTILVIVLSYLFLYKTPWGLRFRSIGENPQAADVAGIKVNNIKWQSVIISGALSGLAGAFFAQSTTTGKINFNGDVAGFGYLALSIMIMGQWNVLLIALSTLLFSVLLGISYSVAFFGENLAKISDLFEVAPYFLTLLIVIAMSKRSKAPAAAGIPYDKSTR